VPAFILGPAVGECCGPFALRRAGRAILRREDHVRVVADDFGLGISKEALGTDVPTRRDATRVQGHDGEVGRTLHDETQQLVAGWTFRFIRAARVVRHVASRKDRRRRNQAALEQPRLPEPPPDPTVPKFPPLEPPIPHEEMEGT
jgi:hypothetical protein